MKRIASAAALAASMVSQAALAGDRYGPLPEWRRFIELGDGAIRRQLAEPDEWSIEWPNGYKKGQWTQDHKGYVTCGLLRAVGPVTDHEPLTNFLVLVHGDAVEAAIIAEPVPKDFINIYCKIAFPQGRVPPPQGEPSAAGVQIPSLGITMRPIALGAEIMEIEAGSASDEAGVRAGMVIVRVNGIPLEGMGSAMTRLLSADASTLSLDAATGEQVHIKRNK